jgi:pimeloyl-ACP methyl ester carboxylesterase
VITPLSDAGYRVIAPDYRGAGHSSHPRDGYTKTVMAADIHTLMQDHLGVKDPVHVVGHDIGGMVAHAYAAKYAEDTASVSWGECPLPGTTAYEEFKHTPGVWHFTFHWQTDLPETLIQGKERVYIKHFYDRLCNRPEAINVHDLDYYEKMFAQPGAIRSGLDLYRAFHQDVEENKEMLKKDGKCRVRAQSLNGAKSFLEAIAKDMIGEMYEDWSQATVADSGHWCAEENPRKCRLDQPDKPEARLTWMQRTL